MADSDNKVLDFDLRSPQVSIPCSNLEKALNYLSGKIGFRLDMIMPADSPTVAVVSGHGITVRLEETNNNPADLNALIQRVQNGADISAELKNLHNAELEPVIETVPKVIPSQTSELIISRLSDQQWVTGRAGMEYRDLIPGRLGGVVIASHIRIQKGGAVPDYVHYHNVQFQIIYCKAGWVRVVYEDQGDAFVMNAGDCVLQPPGIRHRVLECSDGFEVIEVSSPAVHETYVEHEMELPTGRHMPDRLYGGQKFVRHIAAEAEWQEYDRFEFRNTEISTATNGMADVRIMKAHANTSSFSSQNKRDFPFYFVLSGDAILNIEGFGEHTLQLGDCCIIPPNSEYKFCSNTVPEVLEVCIRHIQ